MKRALPLKIFMALGAWSGCAVDARGVQTPALSSAGEAGSVNPAGGAAAKGGATGSDGGSGGVSGNSGARACEGGRGLDGALACGGDSGEDAAAIGGDTPGSGGASNGEAGTTAGDAPASDNSFDSNAEAGQGDTSADGGASSSDTGSVFPDSAGSDAGSGNDSGFDSDTSPNWHLVWSDEFDLGLNSGADTTKWTPATWEPNTVNAELQKYTTRAQNIFHDGKGHLVLRGLHDSWNSDGTVYPYTSGRLQTDGKFQFSFGRVEVRAKLPTGQGSFPAIVLMGTTGDWPQCGEIGMMEQWGQDKSWFYCSTYAGGASGDIGNQRVALPDATTLSSDFHVYALDWYSDHMVFSLDGVPVARSDFNTTSPFFTGTYYLILDVAIGGTMGGTINDAGGFPMDMVLDYVRVHAQ